MMVDMSGLTSLNGIYILTISYNQSLLNLIGLDNLNSIFSLRVYRNVSLIDFSGLSSLNYLDHFDIYENDNLINLNGLENIKFVNQHSSVSLNNSLINFYGLHNLERVGGSFSVYGNPKSVNLSGLGKLKNVLSLVINNNNSLVNFQGLNNLDSVRFHLDVSNNPNLKNFDGLQHFKFMGYAGFQIHNNISLCSINELNSNLFLEGNQYIYIQGNSKLSCCKIMDTILTNNPNISYFFLGNNATGCNDTIEIKTITTQNCCSTKYTFLKDTICQGESVVFDNQTLSTSGTYYDTITVGSIDSIIILQLTVHPTYYNIQNKNLCIGQSFTLSNGKVITTNGTYRDSLQTIFGCDSIIEYRLSFLSNISVNQNPVICKGKTYTLPKGNTVSVAGIYKDTLRSSFGCDSIITTNLTITNPIPFTNTVAICDGQSYTLPNGNKVSRAGIYTDTLRQLNTCDSIIVTNLSVFPNNFTVSLHASDTVESGNGITLLPVLSFGTAVSWNWTPAASLSCTACENPVANPTQNTLYTVTVKATDGCEDTAQTNIVVRQTNVYIPSAFTPNNDGVNDVAEVFAINPKSFSFKIYNRWGELVFESYDVSNKWNGTFKGEDCPQDNYSYILDVTMQNDKTYHKQGGILLLR